MSPVGIPKHMMFLFYQYCSGCVNCVQWYQDKMCILKQCVSALSQTLTTNFNLINLVLIAEYFDLTSYSPSPAVHYGQDIFLLRYLFYTHSCNKDDKTYNSVVPQQDKVKSRVILITQKGMMYFRSVYKTLTVCLHSADAIMINEIQWHVICTLCDVRAQEVCHQCNHYRRQFVLRSHCVVRAEPIAH